MRWFLREVQQIQNSGLWNAGLAPGFASARHALHAERRRHGRVRDLTLANVHPLGQGRILAHGPVQSLLGQLQDVRQRDGMLVTQ
jgi:hypothetical protein